MGEYPHPQCFRIHVLPDRPGLGSQFLHYSPSYGPTCDPFALTHPFLGPRGPQQINLIPLSRPDSHPVAHIRESPRLPDILPGVEKSARQGSVLTVQKNLAHMHLCQLSFVFADSQPQIPVFVCQLVLHLPLIMPFDLYPSPHFEKFKQDGILHPSEPVSHLQIFQKISPGQPDQDIPYGFKGDIRALTPLYLTLNPFQIQTALFIFILVFLQSGKIQNPLGDLVFVDAFNPAGHLIIQFAPDETG